MTKWIIRILFIAIIAGVSWGFYIKNTTDTALGDKFIGVSILTAAFVLMPIFIYYRWKGKDIRKYMLTKENLDKMNDISAKKGKKSDDF